MGRGLGSKRRTTSRGRTMMTLNIPQITLNDGHAFAEVGLGTYNLKGADGIAAIGAALDTGYRVLDTAVNYDNELEVGQAVRRASINHDETSVTSTTPGAHRRDNMRFASTRKPLETRGFERIASHLTSCPNPSVGKYDDTFRALPAHRDAGLVRSTGVSNFPEAML